MMLNVLKKFKNTKVLFSTFSDRLAFCLMLLLSGIGVYAAPPPAGTSLQTAAKATYIPAGISQSEVSTSNLVVATVVAVEAALLAQDQNVVRPAGVGVVLTHVLSNVGNVSSKYTFALANGGSTCPIANFPVGNLQLLRDSNGNGVVDAADTPVPLGGRMLSRLRPVRALPCSFGEMCPQYPRVTHVFR
ncbi:hypothetical protein [Xylophilus rhododendri]|uniref:hypothetical protein n=1 Tax=Xylophilus rhododendri TaxID=2697032 RepID=UPI001E457110|nr:hypothetical protein [Xylophilus rhododendri]